MNLNKKEKILAVGFGIFAAIFMIERFAISPFTEKMESSSIRINAQEDKFKRLLYMESQKDDIIKAFNDVKSYIITEDSEESTFSEIMNTIERMAKASGVIMVKMKPEPSDEVKTADYKTRKVTLSVEGYLDEVVKFLYDLGKSKYPLSVNKLDLKVKSRDTNLMTTDMDVYLIYFS
jgi:hypothetical protein